MPKWSPPKLFVHRQPDGTVVFVDETGSLVATPPTVTYVPANGESKYLDPWGNEVPTYQLPEFSVHRAPDGTAYAVDESGAKLTTQPVLKTGPGGEEGSLVAVLPDGSIYEPATYSFPEEFFVHTAADGTMTAVDASGTPLPAQPTLTHWGPEGEPRATLSDGSIYEPATYQFPREFFVHTAADGTMTAVDASGTPLPTQPPLARWGAESEPVAVMPDGSKYAPATYEFPEFFVHTAADGSMTAVDASGTPLPTQPQLTRWGPGSEPVAALPDGSMYEPAAYQFPREFFVHTAADGSMTAVDASGTPLPTQPPLSHWGPDGEAVAAMPDGSAYTPKPLYPPSGEPPEVWPPEGEAETTEGEEEEEPGEELAAGETMEEELVPIDDAPGQGYAEELLTAGLVEPAAVGESTAESVVAPSEEADPASAGAGGDVGGPPVSVTQPAATVSEVPSQAALDGKGADVVTSPELKWGEPQEQTLGSSVAAMDPDPVDMDPDPLTREEAEIAIEQAAGRAAAGVAAATEPGGAGATPEMKLGEMQEDAIAGKWAGVEQQPIESTEITIEEVAPIEAVAVEEVAVAEVEVAPVTVEETRASEELTPEPEEEEEEASPLDE